MRVFINYKQHVDPDHGWAAALESVLREEGHRVFRDETGLIASERWPARLESEIRECDTMVSLVSNDSLRSLWVLNEIDLAQKLGKRVVPVLLEEIDESLRFQSLNPRFMATQWLKPEGGTQTGCAAVAACLREKPHECYRSLVKAKLSEYGINDPAELVEALLIPLYQSHWPALALGRNIIHGEHKRAGGADGRTLAEALRNDIEYLASASDHNSSNYRKHGDEERSKRLAWQVQRLRCLADILNTAVSAWNQSVANFRPPRSSEKQAYVFDASDGELAFRSPNATSIGGDGSARPVPVDTIVRAYPVSTDRDENSF